MNLEIDQVIRFLSIIIGFFLSLSVLDLKNKVRSLGKLDQIDPLVQELKNVVEKLDKVFVKQELIELEFKLRIETLEKKVHSFEKKLEKFEQKERE